MGIELPAQEADQMLEGTCMQATQQSVNLLASAWGAACILNNGVPRSVGMYFSCAGLDLQRNLGTGPA